MEEIFFHFFIQQNSTDPVKLMGPGNNDKGYPLPARGPYIWYRASTTSHLGDPPTLPQKEAQTAAEM